MTIPIILDMDPGIDDAAAIVMALNHPELEVKLITTVAGNVSVDKTTLNALKLVEFFKKNTPVAAGAKAPLKKEFVDAANIHGESGMPGYDFPDVTTKPLDKDAVNAIVEILNTATEPMTIVATGAYTNIANLLTQHPEIKSKIKNLLLMGGSISGGNVSSVAEFNVFTDPDAAKIVFESGLPITMIGLDVTLKALLTAETIEKMSEIGEAGKMLHDLTVAYNDVHDGGKPMHDVNTIFYLVNPDAIKTTDYWIDVITEGPAIGGTIADTQSRFHDEGQTNTSVGVDIDAAQFNQWFLEQLQAIEDNN